MFLAATTTIIILLWGYMRWWHPMTWQPSSSGRLYYVKRGPGQDFVADRLESLTKRLIQLLDAADDAFPADPRIANVRARWSGSLSEVSETGDVAYSLNKRDVSMCVRGPNGTLESENTSMYVLLHEIAHIATDTYGHPPEFWTNFRWLLEVAEHLGMYTYEDFDAVPTTFCGRTLGNNAMRCRKNNTCRSLLAPKK